MVHRKKREALLSWVQAAGGQVYTELIELNDFSFFLELLTELQKQKEGLTLNNAAENLCQKPHLDPVSSSINDPRSNSATQVSSHAGISVTENSTEVKREHSSTSLINGFDGEHANVVEGHPEQSTDTSKHESNTKSDSSFGPTSLSDAEQNVPESMDIDPEYSNDSQKTEVDATNELNGTSTMESETTAEKHLNGYRECEVTTTPQINNLVEIGSSEIYKNHTSFNVPEQVSETMIQDHFTVIKNFVEMMLELDMEKLISSPSPNKEFTEMDMAMLIVLLLCALFQYSLSVKDNDYVKLISENHIMQTCHSLPSDDQIELKDCLELFLHRSKEQPPVEKKEFQARLTRSLTGRNAKISNHIAASPATTFRTPRQAKNRKGRKNSTAEQVFEASPMMELISSPHMRQITPNSEAHLLYAINRGKKEISALRYDLDNEKETIEKLEKEKLELNNQLYKKGKEIEKLKADLRDAITELDDKKIEINTALEEKNAKLKSLQEDNETLQFRIELLEKQEENTSAVDIKPSTETCEFFCQFPEEPLPDPVVEQRILHHSSAPLLNESFEYKLHLKQDKIVELQNLIDEKNAEIERLHIDYEIRKGNDTSSAASNRAHSAYSSFFWSDRCRVREENNELRNENATLRKEQQDHVKLKAVHESLIDDRRRDLKKFEKTRASLLKKISMLETENAKLQVEVTTHKTYVKEISSNIQDMKVSFDRSINTRKSFEEPGILWSQGANNSSNMELTFNKDDINASSSPHLAEPNKNSGPVTSPDCDLSPCKKAKNKLRKSLSCSNAVMIEANHGATNGKLPCTESELKDIKKLVRHLAETIKNSSYQNEQICSELINIAENFNIVNLMRFIEFISDVIMYFKTECEEKHSLEKEQKELISHHLEYQQNMNELKNKIISYKRKIEKYEEDKTAVQEKHKEEKQLSYKKIESLKAKLNEYRGGKVDPPKPCENCKKYTEALDSYKTQNKDLKNNIKDLGNSLKNKTLQNVTLTDQVNKLTLEKNELDKQLYKEKAVRAVTCGSMKDSMLFNALSNFADELHNNSENFAKRSQTNEEDDNSSIISSQSRNLNNLGAFCTQEDEDDMLGQSSIAEIYQESPATRVKDLNRRNTFYKPHLQSVYPCELFATPRYSNVFLPTTSRYSLAPGSQATSATLDQSQVSNSRHSLAPSQHPTSTTLGQSQISSSRHSLAPIQRNASTSGQPSISRQSSLSRNPSTSSLPSTSTSRKQSARDSHNAPVHKKRKYSKPPGTSTMNAPSSSQTPGNIIRGSHSLSLSNRSNLKPWKPV